MPEYRVFLKIENVEFELTELKPHLKSMVKEGLRLYSHSQRSQTLLYILTWLTQESLCSIRVDGTAIPLSFTPKGIDSQCLAKLFKRLDADHPTVIDKFIACASKLMDGLCDTFYDENCERIPNVQIFIPHLQSNFN